LEGGIEPLRTQRARREGDGFKTGEEGGRDCCLTSVPQETPDPGCGLMRAYGDVEGLAEDVIGLLRDEARRGRLGRAARARVVERFSMERMQRELEAIYERVIAEHQGRRRAGKIAAC
jgi:hypothetical protein